MQNLIKEFPNQLTDALSLKNQIDSVKDKFNGIDKIAICGMGGSAFAGHIVKAVTNEYSRLPIIMIQGYELPYWVDENTLFIACSYSGNTEETLTITKKAIDKTKNCFFITTGGELLDISEILDIPKHVFPGDSKCPRAGIGYPIVAILFLLETLEVFEKQGNVEALVNDAVKELISYQEEIQTEAKKTATLLKDRLAIVYSSDFLSPVSLRFTQQLAENSEQLAHSNITPEMNHNEIMGWNKPDFLFEKIAVLIFHSDFDNERNKKRLKITQEIISKKSNVIEITAKGNSKLSQLLYLIHFSDWVSLELAILNEVDASEIKNIDYFKNELSR